METQPLFSVICRERKRTVERTIRPFILTKENLYHFFTKAKRFKTVFNKEVQNDFNGFLNLFVREVNGELMSEGLFWEVDNMLGLFFLTDIIPGTDAKAHFTFFDGQLLGRRLLTRKILEYVFIRYHFQRISVEVPCYVNAQLKTFVEALGFKLEGTRRRGNYFNGAWFDVDCYGILAKDLGINPNRLANLELNKETQPETN